jgi:3-hydroxyisobutyrate dehydrogenase
MHIGFIGLGNLGKAIAGRLMDCGHNLTVWNRSPDKAASLNATLAPNPAAAVAEADLVCLCLFDSAAVQEVLTADDGVLAGLSADRIVLDFTTNHFQEVLTNHRLCQEAGVRYLESPVLGSVVPASKGALTVLVSGQAAAYQEAAPVLDAVGSNRFHLQEPGLASKMKLINNLALGSFMATLAEAVAFAEQVGIDKAKVLDILGVGGGDSLVLNAKKAKLLQEDFSPHFSNALIYKDLHCLQDLAYRERRPLFTGALTKELFARACDQGLADQDFSAVYRLFKTP